jgi:hypothetical protein
VLAPGERYVDIGKIGVWSPEQVAAVRPDVRYHNFDWGEVMAVQPALYAGMMAELSAAFDAGALRAPPIQQFELDRMAEAFLLLAQGRNIGKFVLALPDTDAAGNPVDADVTDALYRLEWSQQAVSPAARTPDDGAWLVVTDDDAMAQAVRGVLGEKVRLVPAATDPARYRELHADLHAELGARRLAGVLYLPAVTPPGGVDAVERHPCQVVLALLHALLGSRTADRPQLWLLTRAAQAVEAGETVAGLAQASLWGLGPGPGAAARVSGNRLPPARCRRAGAGRGLARLGARTRRRER